MENKKEHTLRDYAQHLDNCNLNQDWDEAFDAFSNTPTSLRDESFEIAYQELLSKSVTCTCGLEKLMLEPSSETEQSSDDAYNEMLEHEVWEKEIHNNAIDEAIELFYKKYENGELVGTRKDVKDELTELKK